MSSEETTPVAESYYEWDKRQRETKQQAQPYTPSPESEAAIQKILAKKRGIPVSSSGGENSLAKIAAGGGAQFADIAAPFINTIPSASLDESGLRMAAMPSPADVSLSGMPLKGMEAESAKRKADADAYAASPEGQREWTIRRLSERMTSSTDQWSTPENTARLAKKELSDPGTFLTGLVRTAIGNTGVGKTLLKTADVAGNIFGIENVVQTPEYREEKAAANSGGSDFIAENIGGGARALIELGLTGKALTGMGIDAKASNLFATQYAANHPEQLAEDPIEFAKGAGLAYLGGKAFEMVPSANIPSRMAGTGAVMAGQDIVSAEASQQQTTPAGVARSFVTGAAFGAMGAGKEKSVADDVNINRAIKAIVGQESGGNSDAVSPTGVKGKYQITEKLTRVLTKKYLGEEKSRDEILGTPEEDIVGRSYIADLYKENLEKSGGDPEKAMHGLALDYYGRGPHSVGPPPLTYAKQIVKRFRTATGEPLEEPKTLSENGLSLIPKIGEGENTAPVAAGDEVTFESGERATVEAVAKTGEVQLSTGEYATPDDFAQGKLSITKAENQHAGKISEPAPVDLGNDRGAQIEENPAPIQQAAFGEEPAGQAERPGSVELPSGRIARGSHVPSTDENGNKITVVDYADDLTDLSNEIKKTRDDLKNAPNEKKADLIFQREDLQSDYDHLRGLQDEQIRNPTDLTDDLRKWSQNKPTNQGEPTNATQERIIPGNNIVEHQRTPPGEDARQNTGEVRQENGGQAIGGDRTVEVPKEEVAPPRAGLDFRTTSRRPQETLDWQEAHPDFPVHNGSSYNEIKDYAVKNDIPITDEQGRKIGFGKLLDNIRDVVDANENPQTNPITKDVANTEIPVPEKPFYESESKIAPVGALRSEIIPGLTDAAGELSKGMSAAEKIRQRIAAEKAATEVPEVTAKNIADKTSHGAPPEAEHSPIGIANKQIDAMREKYGMPPRMDAIRISHPDAYRQAMDRLGENPNIAHELVNELAKKPRVTDAHENVLLVRERSIREMLLEDAASDLNNAVTEGDEWKIAEAKARHIASLESLRKFADVVDRVGTLSGQSLEARKILLDSDDLSLAQMQRQYQATVKAGKALTPEEESYVKAKHEEIEKARNVVEAVRETYANNEALHYADELVKETERLKAENEKLRNASGEIFEKLASGEIKPSLWGEKLKARGHEHVERARARLADIAAGKVPLSASIIPIHPELIKAYTELGVGYLQMGVGNFSNWSKKMLADIGEDIRPQLREIYEGAVASAKEEVFASGGEEAVHAVAAKRNPASVFTDIQKKGNFTKADIFVLARAQAELGVKGLDILSEVHKQVKSVLPETSLREVRDTFTDYGKTKYPSSDKILQELRKVRSLGQLTSKIEDAVRGIAPKRSGVQRDKPTPDVRTLMKQLSAALRDNNIEVSDPGKEIAGKHEARMTRLSNEIEDIEHQLETKKPPPERKPSPEWTAEEKDLRAKLQALREKRKEVFALSEKDLYQKKLESVKIALAKKDAALRERYDAGDFTKKKKPEPIRPDAELLTSRARFQSLKNSWKVEMQRGEAANKPQWQRTVRMITDLRRAGVMLSVNVYGKLTSAAMQSHFMSAPLEEISSSMLRHLPFISQVAEKAPRWGGGFSMHAEGAALSGFKNGLEDGFRMIVAAVRSEAALDASIPDYTVLYGDKPQFSPGFTKRIAATHAALKEPAKQGEFMRSITKRLDYAVRHGEDVNDEVVYDAIAHSAYEDAKRRIWMNDNPISAAWSQAVNSLAASKKHPTAGPLLASAMQMEVPITKVPTNIAIDVANTAVGLPVGIARVAIALAKGVEHLTPEKADAIMRQLSKGVPGAAATLLGMYYHKEIGGFYVKGDKKKKSDANFGEIKLSDGLTLPKELFHATLGMQVMLGATIGRALDRMPAKDKSLHEAIITGFVGLSHDIPYLHAASNLTGALESGESVDKFIGKELKGWVEPVAIQWLARKLDSDKEGKPVKRSQENWKEIFEEGLPYLRELVPRKHKR